MLLLSLTFSALVGSALGALTPPSPAEVALQAGSFGIVVPAYIPSFSPTGILSVTYSTSTGPVSIGGAQQLSPVRVGSTPAIAFNPLAGSATSPLYMLIMVDMDVPARAQPGVLHWVQTDLIMNQETGALTSNVRPAAGYNGPAPPQGSGTHRYVLLLYVQPSGFSLAPKYQNMPMNIVGGSARVNFLLSDFLSSGGFGDPIGGNFFKSTFDGTVGVNTAVVTATGIPAGNTGAQTAPAPAPVISTMPPVIIPTSSIAVSSPIPTLATLASPPPVLSTTTIIPVVTSMQSTGAVPTAASTSTSNTIVVVVTQAATMISSSAPVAIPTRTASGISIKVSTFGIGVLVTLVVLA